jgi:hypothetical protein
LLHAPHGIAGEASSAKLSFRSIPQISAGLSHRLPRAMRHDAVSGDVEYCNNLYAPT